MPRAVDPPGKFPVISHDPGSRDLLFDPLTMPKFDWLAWVKEMLHKAIEWAIGVISWATNGLIDLAPLHEMLDELWDEFVSGIGTGANLLKMWNVVVGVIRGATGIDLTVVLMEMLPALLELLRNLGEIAGATGVAIHELIMLPINILRQLQRVFSGEAVDLGDIPALFQPIINAFTNWWSVVGSALPGAIDAAQQALWYIAELLWRLGQNTVGGLADLINKAVKSVISPLNWNLWGQIRGANVPAQHVAEPSPELLDNPDFLGDISIASQEQWKHDPVAVEPGSARVVADGSRKTLVSNPMQVMVGMKVNVEALVDYAGVSAVANQNAIRMSVNVYDWEANKIGNDEVTGCAVASPAGSATDVKLAGQWVAGTHAGLEDAWIALQLEVTERASAGTVWFHHASAKTEGFTSPQIGFNFVQGIQGIFDIGGTMQTLWDSMSTALQGGGIPGITAPGIVTGASLAQVAQGLHDLAANVMNSIAQLRSTRVELGLPAMTPEDQHTTALGTNVLVLPLEWDYIDVVAVGGGGGGGALFGMFNGQGGWPGGWVAITLIRDGRGLAPPAGATDWAYIHGGANQVTFFRGAGGDGGNGAIGAAGGNGQASTISWNLPDGTVRTVVGVAGQCGGSTLSGWNPANPNGGADGIGPGTLTYRGRQYFGGTNVGFGNGQTPGSSPGGGGGAGILRLTPWDFGTWGGHGAHGLGYLHAYTLAALEAGTG